MRHTTLCGLHVGGAAPDARPQPCVQACRGAVVNQLVRGFQFALDTFFLDFFRARSARLFRSCPVCFSKTSRSSARARQNWSEPSGKDDTFAQRSRISRSADTARRFAEISPRRNTTKAPRTSVPRVHFVCTKGTSNRKGSRVVFVIKRVGHAMTRLEDEPPGWRELCAGLQTAKDVGEFQAILDQINRLLTAHEKAHPETLPDKTPTPRVRNPAKKAKGP